MLRLPPTSEGRRIGTVPHVSELRHYAIDVAHDGLNTVCLRSHVICQNSDFRRIHPGHVAQAQSSDPTRRRRRPESPSVLLGTSERSPTRLIVVDPTAEAAGASP